MNFRDLSEAQILALAVTAEEPPLDTLRIDGQNLFNPQMRFFTFVVRVNY